MAEMETLEIPDSPPTGGGSIAEKPRLSEQEKKNNHIASEQKRRQAIREGFDEIADLTPGLSGHGRSEAMVLDGASRFLRSLLAQRWKLLQQAHEQGLDVRKYQMDAKSMEMAEQAYIEEESYYNGRS